MSKRERENLELWLEKNSDNPRNPFPPMEIINHKDLLEKHWGWDRLLALVSPMDWSTYIEYLEEYYAHNPLDVDHNCVALASQSCIKIEEQLQSAWKIHAMYDKLNLPSTNIVESRLMQERARLIVQECAAGADISATSLAALMCIAQEADLMCELLKRGAKPHEYLIAQSSSIRMSALSLVNCRESQSAAAAAAMLGITKEAKIMCDWMKKENRILAAFTPYAHDDIGHCPLFRSRTTRVMVRLLECSSCPVGSDTSGGAASVATNNTWGNTCEKLNHEDKKKTDEVNRREKKTKRKMMKLYRPVNLRLSLRTIFWNSLTRSNRTWQLQGRTSSRLRN